jgi:hypothetical protein
LRPLIFEHEILLRLISTIDNLKAESMLSILTAAETEMYENSKQKEENRDNSERTAQLVQERDDFMN